jgi:choline dehydrogenase
MYTSNGAVLSILKRSSPSKPDPDLLIFGLVTNFRGYYPGYSIEVSKSHQYFTWAILKGHTGNTAGRVAIRSSDPQEPPDVNFHYFDEGNDATGDDLESVVSAIEFVRGMTARYPAGLVEPEVVPGEQVRTREQIRQFVKDEAWGHHASGTCKIGRPEDPMAVLDSNFRVRGTKGLRVVDASVFPRIPGLFIVSAIYMVAEKASEVILSEGGQPRR